MTDIPTTRASLLIRLRDPQDEAAWRDFVNLYGPLVYRYLRKQGVQDADAADLSQEVFQGIVAGVTRFVYDPSRGHFRNWLFTVVRRKLANWRRSQGRQHNHLLKGDVQAVLNEHPDPTDAVDVWEAEWERCLFAWACEQVHGDVQESTWQAFWRTAIDGQSGKQVADELGLSIAAVYHARSRIRARLQELVRSEQEP